MLVSWRPETTHSNYLSQNVDHCDVWFTKTRFNKWEVKVDLKASLFAVQCFCTVVLEISPGDVVDFVLWTDPFGVKWDRLIVTLHFVLDGFFGTVKSGKNQTQERHLQCLNPERHLTIPIQETMGYILAGTVGFISSLIAYYAIQKIPYVTEVNSFILAEPEDVFEYMKNPRNLPDINYKM